MKVLIVDDDVVSRMVLMHLIDGCGKFEILEAEDGAHAWEQLAAGLRPAICFCDLRMPRLSGMELLGRVRADAALAAMPFVLVTSANDSATVDQACGLGVDAYLVKPFDALQVRACMAPVVARSGAVAETARATLTRLNISSERLLVYLAGFQSQLAGAGAEIAALLAEADQDGARLRIERLQAGCLTLGLNDSAQALRDLSHGVIDGARIELVLAETVAAVVRHGDAVRLLQAGAQAS